MRNKVFLIVFTLLIAIGGGFYAWLGGFKSPEFTTITTSELYLAGRYYEGSTRSEEFGNLFREVAKIKEEEKLSGELANIYYNNPEEGKDSIKAFIGIMVQNPDVALPAGFEIRKVPAGQQALQGRIEAHYVLAPGKLYSELFDYAKENKLNLQMFYVERFPSSHEMLVQVPLAEEK